MFRITNELSNSCSYIYGQIEVKLAFARFISEYLIRAEDATSQVLDEMVNSFDGARVRDENEVFSREELRTYGTLILVEMGMVFRSMYLERDMRRTEKMNIEEHENSKIDITICLCILLSKSLSAKAITIEQNLAKKVLEICQENISALHLAEIQKITSKGGN
jgi:hypothetical protein